MDENINGLHLHVIKTKKFKTIHLALNFTNLLEETTAYKRTMISFLLASSSKKYPTNYALARALDRLYGAVFSTKSSCKGQSHIIHTSLECIDPQYVNDDSFMHDLIDILYEVIFQPNVDKNGFDQKSFDICKEEYALRFEEDKDDKVAYSIEHLFETMGEDTPLAIESFGKEKQISILDRKDLMDYYFEMLEKDRKDLYLIGDISDEMIEEIKLKIHFNEIYYDYPSCWTFHSTKKEVLKVIEKQDIIQCRISLGYTLKGNYMTKHNVAYALLNGMLGSFSHSLLFKIVREKHGLCYSIDSSYDAFNGIMTINAGIDEIHLEQVLSLIEGCINQLKEGKFEEDFIEITKKMMIMNAKQSKDDPYALMSQKFNKDLCNLPDNYSNINVLHALTKQELVDFAQDIQLDTIFILRGNHDE